MSQVFLPFHQHYFLFSQLLNLLTSSLSSVLPPPFILSAACTGAFFKQKLLVSPFLLCLKLNSVRSDTRPLWSGFYTPVLSLCPLASCLPLTPSLQCLLCSWPLHLLVPMVLGSVLPCSFPGSLDCRSPHTHLSHNSFTLLKIIEGAKEFLLIGVIVQYLLY